MNNPSLTSTVSEFSKGRTERSNKLRLPATILAASPSQKSPRETDAGRYHHDHLTLIGADGALIEPRR